MNFKVLTTANWLPDDFSDRQFRAYDIGYRGQIVKNEDGVVFVLKTQDSYYGSVLFCENEEVFKNRFKVTKSLTWRDPTLNEQSRINRYLQVNDNKRGFKRVDNYKGCEEYSSLLASLKHDGFYPEVDEQRCKIRIVCNNCGNEEERSFFEELPTECPCCGTEFLASKRTYSEGAETFRYYTSGSLTLKICQGNSPCKSLDRKYNDKDSKRVAIQVDDSQEKITILGVTETISGLTDPFISKFVLNWEASYSLKDGVVSRKIYGKEKYRDKDIIDLVLENIPLNYAGKARRDVIWYGSKNASLFLLDNQEFFKKIGFFEFVEACRDNFRSYENESLYMEDLMIRFVCLLGQYPVFEQIVKAGHGIIAASIMKDLAHCTKSAAKDIVTQWEKRLNVNSTSSKKALQLPKYVCAYLKDTNASLEDYLFWMQNWSSLDMSKENFEEFVGDIEFQFLKVEGLFDATFCNLVRRWGYNPHKLKRYLVKQCSKSANTDLKDYLNMAEDVGIKPDLYPYHLKKMHDDMVYISRNIPYNEEYVKRIQSSARDLVVQTRQTLEEKKRFPADFKEYIALFPTEKQEFFNEGNAMHSCVGPYMRNVSAGTNIVFFVREKDDPAFSYVTAEWSKENFGVGQVLMSNNRECHDRKAYDFANWVANTIQLGVDQELINL